MSGQATVQRTFFDVSPSDLTPLAAGEAVSVLREMLWAEALRLGIPVTSVDAPFAIADPDGGVDANVDAIPGNANSTLIFPPRTAYQVKTGGFSLRSDSEIEELLLLPSAIKERRAAQRGSKKRGPWQYTPEHLNTRIRSCLDQGGTFVTLLFGHDGAEREDREKENKILQFLTRIDARYANASIRVWRQTQICGLLRQAPVAAARIRWQVGSPLVRHSDWVRQDVEMTRTFVAGDQQRKVIESIQTALRDNSRGSLHLRICGEPGIGKTRLILEATAAPDIQAVVLYAENPSRLREAMPAIEAIPNTCQIILVVDECDPEERSLLRRRFKAHGANIKVISIYMDVEEGDRTSEYLIFEPPPLPEEQIIEIFQQYNIPDADLQPWARECDGSPRVAHGRRKLMARYLMRTAYIGEPSRAN